MRHGAVNEHLEPETGVYDDLFSDAIARGQNPGFVRLVSRLPTEIRNGFTKEQLAFLAEASRAPKAKHMIESKVSLPFFGKRFYFNLLFGRDLRNAARLREEGQLGIRNISLVYGAVFWLIASLLMVTGGSLLYLITFVASENEVLEVPSFLQGLV